MYYTNFLRRFGDKNVEKKVLTCVGPVWEPGQEVDFGTRVLQTRDELFFSGLPIRVRSSLEVGT